MKHLLCLSRWLFPLEFTLYAMEGNVILQSALLFPVVHSIRLFVFFLFPPPLYVQVFVRALFDYDPKEDKAIPCKEAGLAFKKGSILQIMSQDDATWWQAKHEGDANPRAGLIPSKQFQER